MRFANPEGAQAQALTKDRNATGAAPQAISTIAIIIPMGSLLQIRLTQPISTKTAKSGDQFHGTMAAAFSTNDVVALPAGSSVLARVVSAKAAGLHLRGRIVFGSDERSFAGAEW